MTKKATDSHNRWRSITIAFRVSPEENESIHRRARLAGLTKQEYICRRCEEREITVYGNPRVFKAMKEQIMELAATLEGYRNGGQEVPPEVWADLDVVLKTLQGLSQDKH